MLNQLETLRSEKSNVRFFAISIELPRRSNPKINVIICFFMHQGVNQQFHSEAIPDWKVIGCVRETGIVFILNTTNAKKKELTGVEIFCLAKNVGLNAAIGLSGNKHIVPGSCSFVKLSVLLLLLQSLRLVKSKNVFAFNNDLPPF